MRGSRTCRHYNTVERGLTGRSFVESQTLPDFEYFYSASTETSLFILIKLNHFQLVCNWYVLDNSALVFCVDPHEMTHSG